MNKEFKIGDVVKVNTHRYGTNTGNYGTFNVEKVTPSQIHVYDHNTKEVMKFLKHSKRGIGEHSNMMLEEVESIDEETLGEGLVDLIKRGAKSAKRGLQGWDKNSIGPNGEELGNPKDVVKRNRGYSDEMVKKFHHITTTDKVWNHTPGGLQQRVLDREMKKRGLTTEETTDESATSPEWDEKRVKHSKRGIGEHSNMMLEEVEEKLDERTGYGELRHADFNFANSEPVATKVQKKFYVKTKAGKIVSTHSNALDAVKARAKIGDHTTHSIIKEEVEELDEAHKLKDEVEHLDELSVDMAKSYKEKVSKNPAPSRTTPDILHKAIRRFAGKERAEDRIHSDEMKKMQARLGIKEETLDEAKTHEVRLEYGHQQGDSATYKVNAKDNDDATKKAIAIHRKSWPYHSASMLAGNSYITKLDEETIDETAYSPPRKDADPYDEDDYAPGINRDIKTEKPRHKVGDTVYASSSTNKALTMTGKVTKIGHTLTTVKHKDGSEANYPHKLVSKEYSDLHTDPAKKYKQFQREHLEQTGELLTLTEVKYILENSAGGAGVIAQHAGINGNAPAGTGKVKKMMGNKTDATAIAKIIVNGTNLKESN